MFSSLSHYSPHFVPLRSNTITKHAPRHSYQTRSKSRAMGEVEEVHKQIKADMSTLKDQMASMTEAMLSMRRLIESNIAAAAATNTATKADPILPFATNPAHQLAPDIVGPGEEVLGSTGGPHLGYNKNAYPYGLPPNFTPPTMHENMDHVVLVTFEGQLPHPIGGAREEPREHAQVDVDLYPPFIAEGPAFNAMP